MSKLPLILLAALLIGAAFSVSSYFVTREEDHVFECFVNARELEANQTAKEYNTYKTSENGFPFAFYTKVETPKSGGCQQPMTPPNGVNIDALNNIVATTNYSKVDFAKDLTIWSVVFFVLGTLVFGVRKNQ